MGRKEGHYSITVKAGLALYADREAAFNRHMDCTSRKAPNKLLAQRKRDGAVKLRRVGARPIVSGHCSPRFVAPKETLER
jgi:hypothetical protein